MGLQINPELTEEEAFEHLHTSTHKYLGADFVNPRGFLESVASHQPFRPREDMKNCRYFLYNKRGLGREDTAAIQEYLKRFPATEKILLDVSGFQDAPAIYNKLQADSASRRGYLRGIQIFGDSKLVPAFDVEFKTQMENNVDDAGRFYSDFFYSNLENFSLYKNFKEQLPIDLTARWPVARLPLKKGEFAPYFSRVEDYASVTASKPFGSFVNFSSPILAITLHPHDFAFFLKERLDQEFNILSPKEYSLYGNQGGYYPTKIEVLADFTAENLARENQAGIREFIINGHGQWDNIDQCVFETEGKESEKRISFLNMGNINDVLSHNYYNLYLWTCNNAYQLNTNNLIHEAMANGLCLSALAASSILSNSGVDKEATFAELKENNQFNLHNVLSYHYLGVLEYWNYEPKKDFQPLDFRKASTARPPVSQSAPPREFAGDIEFSAQYYSDGFRVLDFTAAQSASGVLFPLEYESSKEYDLSFFDPPNGEIIKKIWINGIEKGAHKLSWGLSKEEMARILNLNRITMLMGFENHAAMLSFDPRQLESLVE